MPSLVESVSTSQYFVGHPTKALNRHGRTKGAKNRVGESVRWAMLESYRRNGGVEWMTRWAKKNPDLFLPMLAKLLPMELAESGAGQPIRVLVYAPTGQCLTEKPVELASHVAIPPVVVDELP